MATRIVAVEMCARCAFGKEKPATVRRKFSIDSDHYVIHLCDDHSTKFDRDFTPWTTLSEDDESYGPPRTMFTSESLEAERRAAESRARRIQSPLVAVQNGAENVGRSHDEVRRDVAFDLWTLSTHARERMAERGYTLEEVLDCAAHPDRIMDNGGMYGKNARTFVKGDVHIGVEITTKTVLTCLPRGGKSYTAPQQYARTAQ